MVVVSSLHFSSSSSSVYCNPISPSLRYFQRFYKFPSTRNNKAGSNSNGGAVLLVRAYMDETTNPISSFANKVIGSLPVFGLIARIVNEEGGVGGDFIDFAEFRRRVGNKCSINDSRAFYEFRDRRGRKRAKLGALAPAIPMELRAEKALEAIHVCCYGRDLIEEEDEKLLSTMLNAVFPTVGQQKIEIIVKEKAKRVADGTEEIKYTEPKQLSKEAVQLQMKDLEFLKQNSLNQ